MIVQLIALILLCTPALIQSAKVPLSLTVVDLGDNATFGCEVSEKELKFLYWYKESLGHMPQSVASVIIGKIAISDEFSSSRFTVKKEGSQYLFTIRNVSKEDEAAYFCQNGTMYSQMFSSGTFLAVRDHNQQKSIYIKQSPKKASVLLGDSVTLSCSLLSKNKENAVYCPNNHSVYWFRAGSERYDPNVIYTHRNSSDDDVKRRCVYSLSKTIQNSSDAGTYYCAVATCGEILFGEGTKVETRPELGPVVLVLGVLLTCCVAVIALLILYLKGINVCEHSKGEISVSNHVGHGMPPVDRANNLTMNYAAVDFSTRTVKRGKKKRKESSQDCVYTTVRPDSHSQQQSV